MKDILLLLFKKGREKEKKKYVAHLRLYMTKKEGFFLSFATTLAILNSLIQTDSKT